MFDQIPASHRSLLDPETKALAWIATVDSHNAPQLTAVWFDTDNEHILFNTSNTTVKYRYLKANPQIAVAIPDPQNAYKYLQIRGTVELVEEDAVKHLHQLSHKYTGKDFDLRPGQTRVKYVVTPQSITIWPPQS